MHVTDERDDAGVTLLEMVVAMGIMSVFMSLFTAGIVQMYRTATTAETTQVLQSRLNLVFERLDAEIRYASAITEPGEPTGLGWNVEYLNVNGAEPVCTQLRLLDRKLQRRTWVAGETPSGGWRVLATEVTNTEPFAREASDGQWFQLRLRMTVAYASSSHSTEFLFTAMNSNTGDADAFCTEGRSRP
ncbi:prepilin-type N-terminal cleavage/methylation domain-containing protein [Actinoplanes sp. NBC_00393]|uniref:PulJ/GspJ family protein n=1 Tax=Actinoplanes sp. NBC_00393 TaxID=2975953 RepID=UPI002E23BF89